MEQQWCRNIRSHGYTALQVFLFVDLFADHDAATMEAGQNGPICRLWSPITRLCFLEMLCFCFPVCTAHSRTHQTCQHGTLAKSAALTCPSGAKASETNDSASVAKPAPYLLLPLSCYFHRKASMCIRSRISDGNCVFPGLDQPNSVGLFN